MGSQCFVWGSVVLSPNRRFASVSKQAANSQTFCVCRTRMPRYTCIDGPLRLHFASARAKGKRSFQTDWQHLASFRTFGRSTSDLPLICRIIRFKQETHETHIHTTWTEVGERTGSPVRPNELQTTKTCGERFSGVLLDPRQSTRSGFHYPIHMTARVSSSRILTLNLFVIVCTGQRWLLILQQQQKKSFKMCCLGQT